MSVVKSNYLILKAVFKYCFYCLGLILIYVLIAVLLSYITVNKEQSKNTTQNIYLNTNGIHLSIVIPIDVVSDELKKDLTFDENDKFARFGWGDKEFYMNVPTWDDFKVNYALEALFLNKPTLMEVSYYKQTKNKWIEVPVTEEQLKKLNTYISQSFKVDDKQHKRLIVQEMYTNYHLYEAKGTYLPTKTCNTWANSAFKESGLKASFWTLFDFGLLNKYKK